MPALFPTQISRHLRGWCGRLPIGAVVAAIVLSPASRSSGHRIPDTVKAAAQDADSGIHIPFTLCYQGDIFVDADLSGVKATCVMDTGSQVTNWPMSLNVKGKSTLLDRLESVVLQTADEQGDHVRQKLIRADYIRIGGYEARHVLGEAVDYKKSSDGTVLSDDSTKTTPFLSSTLFRDHVLTIDYERRELVVYPANYDPDVRPSVSANSESDAMNGGNEPQIRSFPLQLQQGTRDLIGVPVIDAVVDGVPCRMLLDTGGAAGRIGVDARTMDRIRRARKNAGQDTGETKINDNAALGSPRMVPGLRDVTITVGASRTGPQPFQITTDALGGTSTPGMDGWMGWDFLRHFRRVTFDFVRRRIYFEPWTPGSPQDRTGIYPNPSMSTTRQRRNAAISYGIDQRNWDASFGRFLSDTPNTSAHVQWVDAFGATGELWDDGTLIAAAAYPPSSPYGKMQTDFEDQARAAGMVKYRLPDGGYAWAFPTSEIYLPAGTVPVDASPP